MGISLPNVSSHNGQDPVLGAVDLPHALERLDEDLDPPAAREPVARVKFRVRVSD